MIRILLSGAIFFTGFLLSGCQLFSPAAPPASGIYNTPPYNSFELKNIHLSDTGWTNNPPSRDVFGIYSRIDSGPLFSSGLTHTFRVPVQSASNEVTIILASAYGGIGMHSADTILRKRQHVGNLQSRNSALALKKRAETSNLQSVSDQAQLKQTDDTSGITSVEGGATLKAETRREGLQSHEGQRSMTQTGEKSGLKQAEGHLDSEKAVLDRQSGKLIGKQNVLQMQQDTRTGDLEDRRITVREGTSLEVEGGMERVQIVSTLESEIRAGELKSLAEEGIVIPLEDQDLITWLEDLDLISGFYDEDNIRIFEDLVTITQEERDHFLEGMQNGVAIGVLLPPPIGVSATAAPSNTVGISASVTADAETYQHGNRVILFLEYTHQHTNQMHGAIILLPIPQYTSFERFIEEDRSGGYISAEFPEHNLVAWRLFQPLKAGQIFRASVALRLDPWKPKPVNTETNSVTNINVQPQHQGDLL